MVAIRGPALASLHPDWTSRQLAEHVGITAATVNRALQSTGLRMAS
jgi:hypothetical protein